MNDGKVLASCEVGAPEAKIQSDMYRVNAAVESPQ